MITNLIIINISLSYFLQKKKKQYYHNFPYFLFYAYFYCFQIEGLNMVTYRLLLVTLYDAFLGKTIRCNLTDTDDIVHQLQTQLHELDKKFK